MPVLGSVHHHLLLPYRHSLSGRFNIANFSASKATVVINNAHAWVRTPAEALLVSEESSCSFHKLVDNRIAFLLSERILITRFQAYGAPSPGHGQWRPLIKAH